MPSRPRPTVGVRSTPAPSGTAPHNLPPETRRARTDEEKAATAARKRENIARRAPRFAPEFLARLGAALRGGAVHLVASRADVDLRRYYDLRAIGWDVPGTFGGDDVPPAPRGTRVGWASEDSVYIDAQAALDAVFDDGLDGARMGCISPLTMGHYLHALGLIATSENAHSTEVHPSLKFQLDRRVPIDGVQVERRVWVFAREVFLAQIRPDRLSVTDSAPAAESPTAAAGPGAVEPSAGVWWSGLMSPALLYATNRTSSDGMGYFLGVPGAAPPRPVSFLDAALARVAAYPAERDAVVNELMAAALALNTRKDPR